MKKTKVLFSKFKEKSNNVYLLFFALIALIFLSLIINYNHSKKSDLIYSGISIDGVKVSKLSKDEALLKVKEKSQSGINAKSIKFLYDDKDINYPLNEFGYTLDYDKAINEAYAFGRGKNGLSNFFRISMGGFLHKNIPLEANYNDDKINNVIDELASIVYLKPKDANIQIDESGNCIIVKEIPGRYLETEEIRQLIKDSLKSGKDIELPLYKTEPAVSSKMFEGIDKKLGEFTTDYSKSEKNRKKNIKLGARFFKNMILGPGKEISFNKTIGDISEENGFKSAGVIVNGEFDRGIGGGICQVSTTLYNALIRADLEIIERSNHTRPISYVPLGTDAAVARGSKDLKFKNNTNHNIYITSKADGENLSFMVYGNSEDRDYKINIVPKLLEVIEPDIVKEYSDKIPNGEVEVKKSGSKGYSYVTYKEIVKDDEIVKTETLSKSYYIPQDRVVVIGDGEDSDDNDSNENSDWEFQGNSFLLISI